MDMDQSAVFLAGSILTMLGFIIFVIGIVIINNILHKYWKPIRIFSEDSFTILSTPRFLSDEDAAKIVPAPNNDKNKDSDSKNVDLSKNR